MLAFQTMIILFHLQRNRVFYHPYPTNHATRTWYEAIGTMYPVKRNREGNRNCECYAVGG